MHVIDRTDHSPVSLSRPSRPKTKAIVLHRIKYETDTLSGVDGVLDFWMTQPWGVGTTTVSDSAQRLQAIHKWTKFGVPEYNLKRAFVPYHAIVDTDGVVHHFLPWDVKGAHAYPNGKLLGIAFVGDFRSELLTLSQIESGTELIRDLLVKYNGMPSVLRHDDAKRRFGKTVTARKPKGCPGKLFAFDHIKEEARKQASLVLSLK